MIQALENRLLLCLSSVLRSGYCQLVIIRQIVDKRCYLLWNRTGQTPASFFEAYHAEHRNLVQHLNNYLFSLRVQHEIKIGWS